MAISWFWQLKQESTVMVWLMMETVWGLRKYANTDSHPKFALLPTQIFFVSVDQGLHVCLVNKVVVLVKEIAMKKWMLSIWPFRVQQCFLQVPIAGNDSPRYSMLSLLFRRFCFVKCWDFGLSFLVFAFRSFKITSCTVKSLDLVGVIF